MRSARRVGGFTAITVVGLACALALAVFGAPAVGASPRRGHRRTAPRAESVAEPGFPPPAPATAPFAVGVLHVTYTDATRATEARGDAAASTSRAIAVTVRYPTTGDVSAPESENAPALLGTYPLVVFAHGFDTSAETYAVVEHQLAADGFVVAAPDFPMTSSAIAGAPDEADVVNQAGDVSFVISSMLDAASVPRPVAASISHADVGVIGHSDGGVTAAGVAYNATVADPRVGAAVILSGAASRYPGTWFTTQSPPLLAIHATADEVNPFDSSRTLYDEAAGPAMLVAVNGGSHLGPFTTDAEEPEVAALASAFLRAHLAGDTAAAGQLDTLANANGDLTLVAER